MVSGLGDGPRMRSRRFTTSVRPPGITGGCSRLTSPRAFDEINHQALLGRVRARISDKKVLSLVKAFLKAGVLTEDGLNRETRTGTPQGGILSPLLANIALSVLDEHFQTKSDALGP